MSISRKVSRRGGIWTDLGNNKNELDLGDSLTTEKAVRDITTDIIRQLTATSIQIIPGEVTEVIYNEEDIADRPELKPQDIGCIRVSTFEGFELPSEWVFPLDPNIKNYPIYGELVHVICIGNQAYYTIPLNIKRNVNNNASIGITNTDGAKPNVASDTVSLLTKKFKPITGRPTRVIPGDIVIDGREGQSIKLGKNQSVLNSEQELTESKPIIKIRVANDDKDMSKRFIPKEENIIEDAASIYLLKDEEIKLTPSRLIYNDESKTITPTSHKGKQILIDSSKIIFNTKLGDGNNISIYSGNQLNIISKRNTIIIGKNVYIGDARKKTDGKGENDEVGFAEPAVLGEALCDLLYYMAINLESAGISLRDSQGIGNFGMPTVHPGENSSGALISAMFGKDGRFDLQRLKEALLSQNVFISRSAPRE